MGTFSTRLELSRLRPSLASLEYHSTSHAPMSTFDFKSDWKKVKIEERSADEVRTVRGNQISPVGVSVFNPAFDCTPPELITAIICEEGVLTRPFGPKINRLMKKARNVEVGPVA